MRSLVRSRMLWVAAFAGLMVMLLPALTLAQTQNGELNGRVRDPDGLSLPGVTIALTEAATGYTRTAVSQADGAYIIPNLRPGTYDINVTMQGFRTVNQTGLVLSSGAELTVNYDLELATIEEVVTVTAETPLVEVTRNTVGGTLSNREIDEVPTNFRQFTDLTKYVPGMTPEPGNATFEGGGINANGAVGANNMFMIDGAYNNDDLLGAGPGSQVRVVLDIIDEYQVLASQYAAEYGGAAGAVINVSTKGGTNELSGRAYAYFRNDSMYARNAFLPDDQEKPEEKTLQAGFGVGGPIVRDKAHFYFNWERDREETGSFKDLPEEGAPISYDHVGTFEVTGNNFFGRGDVQLNPSNILTASFVYEKAPAIGEGFNEGTEVGDAFSSEIDEDFRINLSLTTIVGDRASNSFRLTRIQEDRSTGNSAFFDGTTWIGMQGNQFALGQENAHPGYTAGAGGGGGLNVVKTLDVSDAFSYFLPDKAGDHNFKFGFGFSTNKADPEGDASSGSFDFGTDLPYNPANPATFPEEFEILVGPAGVDTFDEFMDDYRIQWFVQDKWRVNDRLTLNLGVRWDYQDIVPNSGDDFAPRLGFAYDPTGAGKTVIRGGLGRFSIWTRGSVDIQLKRAAVLTLTPEIQIDEDHPLAGTVLRPDVTTDSQGNLGIAELSAAAEADLQAFRDQVLAGQTYSENPRVDDPNRAMPYQWGWSFGIQHELARNWGVNVDYVANVTRDQIGAIDLNEPILGVRPGVDFFDPDGTLIPAEARGTDFEQVRQYTTRPEFNGDYKSLQVGINKRFSDRYSLRAAYTIQEANYVGSGTERTVWLDRDIRADYGRFSNDRTHVLNVSATFSPIEALSLGAVISASSGNWENETTGRDDNRDNVRNDRPIQGITDGGEPIVSEVDSEGRAVINGIEGPGYFELNFSVRYTIELGGARSLGLFWDMFNVTNRTNLDGIQSNRSSSSFLTSSNAFLPRQMQIGTRFSF